MFSPSRVVGLIADLVGISTDLSDASREERKLAATFAHLLKEAGLDSLVFESKEEVAMAEPDEDEDCDPTWDISDLDVVNEPPPPSDRKRFHFSAGTASMDQIMEASTFFRSPSTKSRRSLSCMKSKFRFLGNDYDLKKMEAFAKEADEDSSRRASRVQALQNLSRDLLAEVHSSFKEGHSLHDADLAVMALNLNREHNYIDGFMASPSFITRFKKKNRICSRHTTKFVSSAHHVNEEAIRKAADDFVAEIKEEMKTRQLSTFCNADQSGFLKELHSNRSLAPVGEKTVLRVVQSKASLTHSYTVMPICYADGRLADLLLVVLQEKGGKFPRTKQIFSAPNLYVMPGTSHIMTKEHMKEWINKCIFTSSTPSSDLVILLDSWTSFRDQAAIDSSLPAGKTLGVRQIPPGATGLIQPLDVYFFRPFKGLG